jgi:hypothetical protein
MILWLSDLICIVFGNIYTIINVLFFVKYHINININIFYNIFLLLIIFIYFYLLVINIKLINNINIYINNNHI